MVLMVAATVALQAQDIITLANGESFYAKNIRFSGDKVYFNRWTENGTSQNVTELSTKDLSKIVYESGEEEFFQKVNPNAKVNTNSGNTVNVNVTGPVNNNYVGYKPNYNNNGYAADYSQSEFLDNPHFNAYAEGYLSLFSLNDGNGSFGGFNSFFTGVSGSAGIRLTNYLSLGAGLGILFGSGKISYDYDYYTDSYRDAPTWFLPVFADIRGFYPVMDDFSLAAELSAGIEFNQFSGKIDKWGGDKCGQLHLNLSVGAEIKKITVNLGVMSFAGMRRVEEYYNYGANHSHSVDYYKRTFPMLYLRVGYKFGE